MSSDTYSNSESTSDSESNFEEYSLIGEILKNTYILIYELGSGTFATVWLAYNISNKKFYAIKIHDYGEDETAYEEISFFTKLKNESCPYINKLVESFEHENSICMVFDLMAGSLYDIMKIGRYKNGFNLNYVKKIVSQLLTAMNILNTKHKLVHTDLKTENILITGTNMKTKDIISLFQSDKKIISILNCYQKNKKNKVKNDKEIKKLVKNMNFDDIKNKYKKNEKNKNNEKKNEKKNEKNNEKKELVEPIKYEDIHIKLSDFGNCRDISNPSFHIQTRYYRSPEVILEYELNENCDMWSVGCLIYELLTGNPLFDPDKKNHLSIDQDHILCMISTLGKIPDNLLNKSKNRNIFFKSNGLMKNVYSVPITPLKDILEKNINLSKTELELLHDFMIKLLEYDPFKRLSPKDALNHKFMN